MTDGNDHLDPSTLSPAARLRAAADGEIAHPTASSKDDASRIAFERGLRAACSRAMQGAPAPDSLRQSVLQAMRAEPFGTLKIAGAQSHEPPQRAAQASDDGPISFPSRPPWMRFGLAVAAMLAIAAGAFYVQRSAVLTPVTPVMLGEQRATILADFANEQHQQCADFGPAFEGKMTARTVAEAQKAAIELLSHVPEVLELKSDALAKAGYQFAGLGRCHVPGTGRSAHLLYKPDSTVAPGAPVVSLFIQEDTGELTMDDFCAYRKEGDPTKKRCCMTVWRSDGLIYYLVTPKGTPPEARNAFSVPERERLL